METAPEASRDAPPKKDKFLAKKKKARRYWEEETTPTAAGVSLGPPRKKKRKRELRPQSTKHTHTPNKSHISKKPQVPKKRRERRNLEPQRSLSGVSLGLDRVAGQVALNFGSANVGVNPSL